MLSVWVRAWVACNATPVGLVRLGCGWVHLSTSEVVTFASWVSLVWASLVVLLSVLRFASYAWYTLVIAGYGLLWGMAVELLRGWPWLARGLALNTVVWVGSLLLGMVMVISCEGTVGPLMIVRNGALCTMCIPNFSLVSTLSAVPMPSLVTRLLDLPCWVFWGAVTLRSCTCGSHNTAKLGILFP